MKELKGKESAAYTKLRAKCEDVLYITNRNRLIPAALEEAYKKAGPKPLMKLEQKAWGDNWNVIFFSTMTKLAEEAGL